MKIAVEEENKISRKQIIIYISIMIVCIISIIIAFYVQFYARINVGRLFGFETDNEFNNKTEEETQSLLAGFDQIFTNNINIDGQINFKAKDDSKPIVYTNLEKEESKLNSYDIKVNIPYINIDDEIIDKYNKEIEDFINKTDNILDTENKNTIYTVEYVANVYDDILSLMIRSNLKEGSSAQRVIIQTYNYDLRNNKEISLEEILKIKGLDINNIQSKIKNKIEDEQKKVQDLKDLGYNIYSRDATSDVYNIENSKEFYITENVLYVIYAYGNKTFTSEMDLIII